MYSLRILLITLRNGMMYEKEVVTVPYSVINHKILSIFLQEGFIATFFRPYDCSTEFRVLLRPSLSHLFRDLKLFSSHSLVSFRSYKELSSLISSTRFGLITTNSGLLTLEQAYTYKLGGRILFTM